LVIKNFGCNIVEQIKSFKLNRVQTLSKKMDNMYFLKNATFLQSETQCNFFESELKNTFGNDTLLMLNENDEFIIVITGNNYDENVLINFIKTFSL
jgi:hypothetical protein